MADIFISYAAQDRSRANLLADAFSARGWSVWWDRQIAPGQTFDDTIERALTSARCIIVLWSRDSVSSRWVKTEAAEGAARGILVPVLIDRVAIPLEFRRIQAADLSGWPKGGSHPALDELLSTLDGLLSGTSATAMHRIPTSGMSEPKKWWAAPPVPLMITAVIVATATWAIWFRGTAAAPEQKPLARTEGQISASPSAGTSSSVRPLVGGADLPSGMTESYVVTLSGKSELTLGDSSYKIVDARADLTASRHLSLKILVRMTNSGKRAKLFGNANVRLLADGVLRAPESATSIVPSFSATDTWLEFRLSDTVANIGMQAEIFGEGAPTIPLALKRR